MPQQFETSEQRVHARTTAQKSRGFPGGWSSDHRVGTAATSPLRCILNASGRSAGVAVEPTPRPCLRRPPRRTRSRACAGSSEDWPTCSRVPGEARLPRDARRSARYEGILVGIRRAPRWAAIAQKLPDLPSIRPCGLNYDTVDATVDLASCRPELTRPGRIIDGCLLDPHKPQHRIRLSELKLTRPKRSTPTLPSSRRQPPLLCARADRAGRCLQAQLRRPQGGFGGRLHRRRDAG